MKTKIKKVIGIIMLVVFFAVIFISIGVVDGFGHALKIFGATAVTVVFLLVAAGLIVDLKLKQENDEEENR